MVNYVIDIAYILVAVLVLAIFTKRGFVGSLFKLGKTIISSLLAFLLGPKLGDFFYNKWFYNGVYNWVSGKINSVVDGAVADVDIATVFDNIPFILRRFISEEAISEKFNKGVADISTATDEIAVSISVPVAETISDFLAYIAVFAVSVIFLMLFGAIVTALVKRIPIVKHIDRILGFILGLVFMFIILSLITFVLGIIVSLLGGNETFVELVSASKIFEFFGKNNIVEILRP